MKDKQKISLLRILGLLGIVALVLIILAIPFLLKAREAALRDACFNNMMIINSGIESSALANSWKLGDKLNKTEVGQYIIMHGWPKCPSGAEYIAEKVGDDIVCPVHGKFQCSWGKWPPEMQPK